MAVIVMKPFAWRATLTTKFVETADEDNCNLVTKPESVQPDPEEELALSGDGQNLQATTPRTAEDIAMEQHLDTGCNLESTMDTSMEDVQGASSLTDKDRDAAESYEEFVHQQDLQAASQQIFYDESDSDEDVLQPDVAEAQGLSGVHWNEDFSLMMQHCSIQSSGERVNDNFLAPANVLLNSQPKIDSTLKTLEELIAEDASPSQPLSSQLIDIEMAALAVEMVTSEEDWLRTEREHEAEEQIQAQTTSVDEKTGSSVKRRKLNPTRSRTQYYDPLPLMIDDVLGLLKGPLRPGRSFAMYGLLFKRIAIYGRCTPLSYSTGNEPNTKLRRLYEVDDGTATIQVVYEHYSKERVEFLNNVNRVDRKLRESK